MNTSDKKNLQKLFDIGEVEFKTFVSLPEDIKYKYINRFKKKISLDDFDSFCSYYMQKEVKDKLLSLFEIECEVPYYFGIDLFKLERERNVQFTRDLKIKLLCQ